MPQKPMDFNPLDILAAAALGEKGVSSEAKPSESETGEASGLKASSEESNDAEDDPAGKTMGKTKNNSVRVKQLVAPNNSGETDMAPQKLSWSPETFLSCLKQSVSVSNEKLIMENLSCGLKGMNSLSDFPSVDSDSELSTKDEKGDRKLNSDHTGNEEIKNGSLDKCVSNGFRDSEDFQNRPTLQTNTVSMESDETLQGKVTCECPVDPMPELDHSVQDHGDCHSDTDTAETMDCKHSEDGTKSHSIYVALDHPYSVLSGQLPHETHVDPFDDDDDIDVCSDSSPLAEDSEQRSRNLSLDCNYLKPGIVAGASASALDLYQDSSLLRSKLPSSSSSASSPTLESQPKVSQFKEENTDSSMSMSSPTRSSFSPTFIGSPGKPSPKCGKFRIGTFASFSSSNLELEKYLRNKEPTNEKRLNIGIPSSESNLINSTLNSPSAFSSVHPMLQSPSLDWDRSEAGSETQDDSSDAKTPQRLTPDFTTEKVTEWTHPMYHDHDYCVTANETKTSSEDNVKFAYVKRKYTRRKNKLDAVNHEKILKAKYLKKELLKRDNFLTKSTPIRDQDTLSDSFDSAVIKTNPVGRPRKRPSEKAIEDEIDPETGTKMKITGKFQDQYVYYLSKSSRTTRRRQTPTMPLLSDKIIVPAPKPGDIFVPHLTDADIEVVRLKGRSALNIPERPHMPNVPSIPLRLPAATATLSSSQPNELSSDVVSHIVSTILSMENDNLVSPSSSQQSETTNSSDLYPSQPGLTDSLRMMSDSSIPSDVLNYLLGEVKEGETPENSHFFPPLPTDSLYPKTNNLDDVSQHSQLERTDLKFVGKGNELKSENHDMCNRNDKIHEDSNVQDVDDQACLVDDLSSLMSHSQVTTSSSTVLDCTPSDSVKGIFGSELMSLGTPQLSSNIPRLTSIEKTLDFLGVKDGELKLEHDDMFGKVTKDDVSSPLSAEDPSSTADDTPWIVTVTLYFNDVPAIMINSQPYIRLVDIHKQILPAKDTGILKKRCQLLNIPVLNCSEMQRYFLVQYGRAYNSKSTLIVSKDQANALVTYYATPQPRIGRSEEAHVRRISCSVSSDGSNLSPVDPIANSGPVKKRSYIKKGHLQPGLVSSDIVSASSPRHYSDDRDTNGGSATLNKRTRHKKINYLEMLKGEDKDKSDSSVLETIESVIKSQPENISGTRSSKNKANTSTKLSVRKRVRTTSCVKKTKDTSKKKKRLSSEKPPPENNSEKGSKCTKDTVVNVKKLKASMNKPSKNDNILHCVGERSDDVEKQENTDVTQSKAKSKPLKLKVKSLLNFAAQRSKQTSPPKRSLFSRSNSSQSDRPLRVLAVAHQAALSGEDGESRLPSQPAEIHLDLFTKSNSACICCHTCSQFLSVPHFMRHHHVPMDNEWLATEAAHRILVPRNKENISEEEKKLWEEFHRLQEAIGGFGEGDDESDMEDDDDEDDADVNADDDGDFDQSDRSTLSMSGNSSLSVDAMSSYLANQGKKSDIRVCATSNGISSDEDDNDCVTSPRDYTQSHLFIGSQSEGTSAKNSFLGCKNNTGITSKCIVQPLTLKHESTGIAGDSSTQNVRTSSRKRKSKQLFSIENYYTPKKIGNEEDARIPSTSVVGCT